ncbi:hypothetical protein [Pseudomonas sp. MWU12-2323]|uniref:hypothetical protein n=1 Tax=Pseudomonas sp. MWU12-2323 TaxID=2651296 RepID=UPI00128BC47A|nr:hypothetical protein [Pseudomonas sp. MWU12-2323]MPQ69466.1 hypothetical protein [Pseudomonas sp. MWU12-2323]
MSEEQTLSDYLPTVKAGDSVLVRGANNAITQRAVVKVTKTQIVVRDNVRFRLSDGSQIGGIKFSPLMIIVPTADNKQRQIHGRLERWAKSEFRSTFAFLTVEQQLEIYNLVRSHAAKLMADPPPETKLAD